MVISKISILISSISLALLSCQANARAVRDVIILESGLSADSGDSNLSRACKKFKPTAKQVKEYFSKAYPIPKRFAVHERYSACYATGTIKLDSFGKVKWVLSSGGTATIKWDEGEIVDVFNKKNDWYDPNACTYGLSIEGEC